MSETVTFPTCMDFQAPLESYTLTGTSIPGDLAVNLNPQPGTSGDLFDTVRINSMSGQSSGPLQLIGKVAKVANLNEYRAQIEYLSPFDRLEVHLYDGAAPRTAQNIHAERVVAVRNSDYFDYHTVFHDSQKVKGDVEHLSCGGDDEINMEYRRIPGRAKNPITFIADLGADCDRQRFDMDAYSDYMKYKIEWDHLFKNNIHAELTQPLQSLKWWRMSHRIGEAQVRTAYPLAWYVAVNNAPVGDLDVGVRPGVAGQILAASNGGFLGSIDVGISAQDSSTWYMSLHMTNVKLRVEWDLDGDTRHAGNPRYVFADTGGQYLVSSLRFRFGAVGFALPDVSARMNEYQLKWGLTNLGLVSVPWFKKAGSITILPGFQFEVLLGGEWYRVPKPLLV